MPMPVTSGDDFFVGRHYDHRKNNHQLFDLYKHYL